MKKHVTPCLTVLIVSLALVATAESISAQCRTVDLANLKIGPVAVYPGMKDSTGEEITQSGATGYIKDITNEWAYVFNYNQLLNRFHSILQTYKVKTICAAAGYINNSVHLYEVLLLTADGKPIKGDLLPKSKYEQCLVFKPGALFVVYSDSEQAQVLTDGNVVLDRAFGGTEGLKNALAFIQEYSLDNKCVVSYGYSSFTYYKSQHYNPPQSTSSANSTNAKFFAKAPPLAPLDDKALRADAADISAETLAMRLLFERINRRRIKWPPDPRDPIIKELLARESQIFARTALVSLRRKGTREPQGLKAFGALRPLVNQLHSAVDTFMKSRDANSGSANLRQISSIADAIRAKAAEIK